jgi:hypothetical protein
MLLIILNDPRTFWLRGFQVQIFSTGNATAGAGISYAKGHFISTVFASITPHLGHLNIRSSCVDLSAGTICTISIASPQLLHGGNAASLAISPKSLSVISERFCVGVVRLELSVILKNYLAVAQAYNQSD